MMSCAGPGGISQRGDNTASGVSAIDRITAAVSTAFTLASKCPGAGAVECLHESANKPPSLSSS